MTRFLAALAPFALITTPLTAQDDSLAPAAPPESLAPQAAEPARQPARQRATPTPDVRRDAHWTLVLRCLGDALLHQPSCASERPRGA